MRYVRGIATQGKQWCTVVRIEPNIAFIYKKAKYSYRLPDTSIVFNLKLVVTILRMFNGSWILFSGAPSKGIVINPAYYVLKLMHNNKNYVLK